jgi:EAL domain-containing protein (putative c-di-GMP-specific phosphodiesterase class I)
MPLNAYVLDDEVQVGKVVCQMLVATGFLPRQFTSPAPFLAALGESTPELIVLDLALGQSDAIEIMRRLEAVGYTGKVLLISGHDETMLAEVAQIGERRGFVMLEPLTKPFRIGDFKKRLAIPDQGSRIETNRVSQAIKATPKVLVDLGEALRNRWLELWYQSKIDLKSLSVCGAEALLRARHPVHGVISPADLLPPAGDPLYGPLSKFVIEQAMTDWNYFSTRNIPIKLAVNIPASVLVAPDFIRSIREWLPKNPNFPGLVIEVTEDEIIRDAEAIREAATQLKLYNIRLSIDDFGTAYSSLARLRDLPFSELKLDRSFVSNCASDSAKQSLCLAAIDLAHDFGASICAEGVENADDLRVLIEMQCDTAQGFLFAKPMPFDQFVKMMRTSVDQKPFALTA